MKKLLLAAVLTVASAPSYAQEAHDWYILNFKTGECDRPLSVFPTPLSFHNSLRSHGTIDNVQIYRQKGTDAVQFITIETPRSTTFWFSSLGNCEVGKLIALRQGIIANPQEMQ